MIFLNIVVNYLKRLKIIYLSKIALLYTIIYNIKKEVLVIKLK